MKCISFHLKNHTATPLICLCDITNDRHYMKLCHFVETIQFEINWNIWMKKKKNQIRKYSGIVLGVHTYCFFFFFEKNQIDQKRIARVFELPSTVMSVLTIWPVPFWYCFIYYHWVIHSCAESYPVHCNKIPISPWMKLIIR